MQGLTKRQEQTLDFIRTSIEEPRLPADPPRNRRAHGHPLDQRRQRSPARARAQGLPPPRGHEEPRAEARRRRTPGAARARPARTTTSSTFRSLGRVAAGLPLLAEENVVDTVRVDRMLVRGGREVFGLRVTGDSMIEAGILGGDYIFVRKQSTAERGDIVVALIGDEATVKYFYPGARLRALPARQREDGAHPGARVGLQVHDAARQSRRRLPPHVMFRVGARRAPRPRLCRPIGRA